MNASHNWPTVSDEIRDLMRQGAEIGIDILSKTEILDEVEDAVRTKESGVSVFDDPVVQARQRRSTRTSILHWLNETIERPDKPVPPLLLADEVNTARELHRSGASHVLHANARSTQDIAWQYWMKIVFQITSEPKLIQPLLEVSSLSITMFVEGCIQLTMEQIEKDNQFLLLDRIEEQRELTHKIIEGTPINLNEAERVLEYSFKHKHHCAIIWSEEVDIELSALEKMVDAFQKACQQKNILKVISSNSVIWIWAAAEHPINEKVLESSLNTTNNIRLSYASSSNGIDGFRRAYLDALAAQKVLGRLKSSTKLVSYERVRLMAFLSKDSKSIQHYSEHVLGDLAEANADIRRSLHAFLECGCNATEAAKKLHTHRNTLLRRLSKAEEMLPRPLSENRIQVAVALEALYWIL